MSDNLSSLCAEFINRLASSSPVPGGGGAAALCGALASALCSMAGELSRGNKSTLPYSAELEDITTAAKEHAGRFLTLSAPFNVFMLSFVYSSRFFAIFSSGT